ncbi:MAG: FliO/MopB family protein [Christensenellales bacterium]|jgi:flagellar biogenesis protein FliO
MVENTSPSAGSAIVAVVVMLLVIAAAYYTTKLLSRQSSRLAKGRRLEITDRLFLAKDKHIVLLKADERTFIIGVTAQSMNVLGELEGQETKTEGEETSPAVFAFGDNEKGFKAFMKNAATALERLKTQRSGSGDTNHSRDGEKKSGGGYGDL